jgi:uncharacterized membrane protein YeaQ/YmgE (transglycosylase-associated protein family)
MSIIAWIIIGGLAGWVASMILRTNGQQGILGNIIAGILGGIIGGLIFRAFGTTGVNGWSVWSFLVALVGAIVVLLVKGAITGRRAL